MELQNMKRIFLIFAAILFPAIAAAQTENACRARAVYFDLQTTKSFDIYSGPGKQFSVIKKLAPDSLGKSFYAFEITGSKNGWFKISRAFGENGQELFRGEGWIPSGALSVSTPDSTARRPKVYERPDRRSRVLKTLAGGTEYPFKDCRGDWIKISYADGGGMDLVEGWLEKDSYCGGIADCEK
jgi:SH3-like domain-containing protein